MFNIQVVVDNIFVCYMRKFESSQKDESRAQSADSSKAYRKRRAFCCHIAVLTFSVLCIAQIFKRCDSLSWFVHNFGGEVTRTCSESALNCQNHKVQATEQKVFSQTHLMQNTNLSLAQGLPVHKAACRNHCSFFVICCCFNIEFVF